MPLGMIFWLFFILYCFGGLWWNWPNQSTPPWGLASHGMVLVLIFLLGCRVFGFVVQ